MIKLLRTTFIRNSVYIQTINQKRTLYSSSALGLDGYVTTRDKIKNQFLNNETKFREKMKEYVEDKSSMIFTEDLRNIVHIADKNDIDLVIKMIEKFNFQNKEIRFGNYVFGPVVMRMFYHLGDIDSALKCFLNKDLTEFFNQPTSCQILFDMLYKSQRYNEILEIYDTIKKRLEQNPNAYKHVITLTFAACYKMNTPDSFKHCLDIWRELNEKGIKTMRRTATFIAGLALKQNSPHIALEIVSTLREQQYLTVRNIKTQAYAELDRPEDAIPILRSILEIDDVAGGGIKQTFVRDVVNKVQESIAKNHQKDLESDFNRVLKFLEENGHISDQTMDEILCREISTTALNTTKRDQGYLAATFSRNNTRTRNQTRRRQGLQDLY